MEVVVAKKSGFCFGVKTAMGIVEEHKGEKDVCILGELIHNPDVIEKIEKKGIKTIQSIDEIEKGTLIVRTHGEGKKIFEKAKEKGLKVVDATCPFVKKSQRIVEEYYSKGYQIVVIGESAHAEVVGINGWCDDSAIIISDIDFEIDLNCYEKLCVVVQTTFSEKKYNKIVEKIKKECHKIVEIFPTICYTTMERQNECDSLSKTCDAMIVIGGLTSSNTNKLSEICLKNCKDVYRAVTASEVDYKKLKKYKKIGIVSGASTPDDELWEVFFKMSEITKEQMQEQNVNGEKEMTMEDVMSQIDNKGSKKFRKGEIIKATISQADDDGLKLNIGAKTETDLPKEELLTEEYKKENYEIGAEIEVMVKSNEGKLVVSEKMLKSIKENEKLIEGIISGEIFTAKVEGTNKGGLTATYAGQPVFIPSSQIRIGFVKELEKYVGKELRLRAVKVEERGRVKQIVASQRVILEEEKAERDRVREEKVAAFFGSVNVGDVVEGEVVRIVDFGAFVNINGFDCLAHISDLSWSGVTSASDVLEVGKKYSFKVLKINEETRKVSIGYKQLQPKPWVDADLRYPVGSIVHGKIVRIVDFGAFVEVEKGIDGLVHLSQITNEWLENPLSLLEVGQEIDAQVMAVDVENEKMNLSIKALLPEAVKVEKVQPKKEEKEGEEKPRRRKARQEEKVENDEFAKYAGGESTFSIADLLNKKN